MERAAAAGSRTGQRAAGWYQVPSGRCSSSSFTQRGYQVWRNTREGYRLDGGRSQFGFIFPEKSLAIVCNAIEEDSGLIPRILLETLYPAIAEADAEAAFCEGYQALNEYLQACAFHIWLTTRMRDSSMTVSTHWRNSLGSKLFPFTGRMKKMNCRKRK